jgi:hypothetical protein
MSSGVPRKRFGLMIATCAMIGATQLTGRAQAPSATSPAPAKELAALLQSKKLEAFAVKDTNQAGRFVAVLMVPNVELMVVSAVYDPPSAVEYRIYTKDYMTAYVELNSSVQSKEKVFVEDPLCDGLAVKSANGVDDTVTIGSTKNVFDGEYTDPKKKPDSKKPNETDYFKAFADADAQYTKMLTMLIAELKKTAPATQAAAEVR